MEFYDLSKQYFTESITGRYINNEHISPFILKWSSIYEVKICGYSSQQRPIHLIKVGSGSKKILVWSQMHGNESTCTKALVDLLHLLETNHVISKKIKDSITLYIVPILNPDGAEAYTRENANGIDLNRDAKNETQPESLVLKKLYKDIQPDFCFNMHDQRTIYGVGFSGKPATVAFLSPSFDETRVVNTTRTQAMACIAHTNEYLQKLIPGQVARFDDAFNENCFGEYFTMQNTPTILFEGGHFQNDFARDEVRKYIFVALLGAMEAVYENVIVDNKNVKYFNIPQNISCFYDFIYKNVTIFENGIKKIINFAAQFEEIVEGNAIHYKAILIPIETELFWGHVEYDANGSIFKMNHDTTPVYGSEANFTIGKQKFINGVIVS